MHKLFLFVLLCYNNYGLSIQTNDKSQSEPKFSIGLGVLAPSYSQKLAGNGRLDFNQDNNGFSYSLNNVHPQSSDNSQASHSNPQQYQSAPTHDTGSHYSSPPSSPKFSIYHHRQAPQLSEQSHQSHSDQGYEEPQQQSHYQQPIQQQSYQQHPKQYSQQNYGQQQQEYDSQQQNHDYQQNYAQPQQQTYGSEPENNYNSDQHSSDQNSGSNYRPFDFSQEINHQYQQTEQQSQQQSDPQQYQSSQQHQTQHRPQHQHKSHAQHHHKPYLSSVHSKKA